MKHAKTILAGAIAMLAAAAMPSMARAQASLFGEKLNRFLNEHPRLAETVRADPQLLYSKKFREQHPELQVFMQEHPEVYAQINRTIPRQGEHGPGGRGPGAYDREHQWRDANWWHENDPNWANKNHPEWAESHPEWNKPRPVMEAHPEMAPPGAQATTGQTQKHGHHKGNPNEH